MGGPPKPAVSGIFFGGIIGLRRLLQFINKRPKGDGTQDAHLGSVSVNFISRRPLTTDDGVAHLGVFLILR